MKSICLLAITILFIPLSLSAQDDSNLGVGIQTDLFPGFQLLDNHFTYSRAYTLQLSFYDTRYTRLEYGVLYTRGYHHSISYSAGINAAYRVYLSDQFILKPGIGLDGYKLADRTCRTSIRSILDNIFNTGDTCTDDVHASFSPFIELEWRLVQPLSVYAQTTYRAMLSSTNVSDESGFGTDHSFYGSGTGFGFGIRLYF
jgi:hypothetical protein